MSTELCQKVDALLKARGDAEQAIAQAMDASDSDAKAAARMAWFRTNEALIELLSPHKTGVVATYTKGSKTHRLLVQSVSVSRRMRPDVSYDNKIEDMGLWFQGMSVRRDGSVGVRGASFIIRFNDLPAFKS